MINAPPWKTFTLTLLLPVLFLIPGESLQAIDNDSLAKVLSVTGRKSRAAILNAVATKQLEAEPGEAIRLASEALKLSREYNDHKAEARALFLIADAHYFLNDQDQAIRFYLASAEVEKKAGGTESEAYASRIGDAGYCYYSSNRYPQGLRLMQESLELSLAGGFESQAASMYCNIGNIYTEWGDYAQAIDNYQKALEIDRRLDDPLQIATDLNNIGKVYEQWTKFDEAVRYYKESLGLARAAGNQAMVAIRLNNIAIVYKEWEKFPEALDYFNQALEIERGLGNMEKVGRRLTYIAATYLASGSHDKCLLYLNQASPLVMSSGQEDDLSRFYNIFGKYYLATGNYKRAVETFLQSQQTALKNNLKPLQMANLKSLAEAYERSGNPVAALETYKKFVATRDSVFNAESDVRLAEFQARFENEKMRLENETLKKDARLKRDIYLLSGLATLALVLILIGVIVILQLKARNARQLKQMAEQETARLEMELELRNKELTCNAMSIIRKNESVAEMIGTLEKAIQEGQPAGMVKDLLEKIRNGERESSWKEFEVRFTNVHQEFYSKLNGLYPELTPNERKLCAFLRLNMTTKDIASITHQSIHSINVARTRLRRKLNLANSDENLINFLMSL
jgi:tetratricopeptide (TPR) repeat protein